MATENVIWRAMARLDTWTAVWAMDVRELTRHLPTVDAQERAWEILFRQCPQEVEARRASALGL